ncbi:hypothetical protein IFM89_002551 [Coptis chinensis]|uniref:Uncharacterized protein n=1 Tax=Coptis chinensis TaxID=261450 RepID=A0A835HL81_9MAGN|nr:hypothetical protein IFM89_002551 [Coptis chinensis]
MSWNYGSSGLLVESNNQTLIKLTVKKGLFMMFDGLPIGSEFVIVYGSRIGCCYPEFNYEVELESFVKERELWDKNTPEKIEKPAGNFIEYDTNFIEEETKQSKVLEGKLQSE